MRSIELRNGLWLLVMHDWPGSSIGLSRLSAREGWNRLSQIRLFRFAKLSIFRPKKSSEFTTGIAETPTLTRCFSKARSLFESDEEFLELVDDYGFEKAPVLEALERYVEAGCLRAAAGETVAATRLFTRGGDHDRAAECLCDAFWGQLPYTTPVTDQNREQVHNLEKLLPDILEPGIHWKNQVRPHNLKRQALMRCSSSLCSMPLSSVIHRPLRRLHSRLPMTRAAVPTLLFYGALTTFRDRSEKMNRLLRILHLFSVTYRRNSRLPHLETEIAIQRAFGFRLDESGPKARISPTSSLSRIEIIPRAVIRTNDRNDIVVNARQLGFQIATILDGRLVSVLSNHAVICLSAKSFGYLCSTYLDERQLECQCHRLHVKRGDVTTFYNQQLQLHLRQILVLSQGEPHDWKERRHQRK